MHIEISWQNPDQTIIFMRVLRNNWSIDDMQQAIEQAWGLMKSVDHRVDFLLDARAGNHLPPNVVALARWAMCTRPGNFGDVAVVGGTAVMKEINAVIHRTYRNLMNLDFQVTFVDTMEEALDCVGTQPKPTL